MNVEKAAYWLALAAFGFALLDVCPRGALQDVNHAFRHTGSALCRLAANAERAVMASAVFSHPQSRTYRLRSAAGLKHLAQAQTELAQAQIEQAREQIREQINDQAGQARDQALGGADAMREQALANAETARAEALASAEAVREEGLAKAETIRAQALAQVAIVRASLEPSDAQQ